MKKKMIKIETSSDGDMAYLFLPKHPGKGIPGVTSKQISLNSVISNYQGPEILLDFDKAGEIIGMEFVFD
ncbi:DUF2283 domain-containing protein [Morganella morganii]|uniref:DUF2283 domain-containing protein n=1 Tax=Morganella morganii TaxID=582 RepID=UPI001BDA9F50|nr:DUF2283 domain-containing protein [Morganella morganii]ELT0454605.1 DUF2283 domain-containing protein [Morganella morganii]MBT0337220.1 DUF2283 domain-containing protein [Morganella morganii subsp. morganii]